ncbi:nuclease domain-containing protein, partial [Enterobacteriaceae bacterium LUAb1]
FSMKADDLFGAWCCSACHDCIDRRNRAIDAKYAHTLHMEGIIRTQAVLIQEGKIRT